MSPEKDFYATLLDAFEEVRHNFSKKHTVKQDRVPPLFREFNILSGYRPIGKHFSYYLRSFFMLHNESMNVWTHFFGCLLILREGARFYDDFHLEATFDTLFILVFVGSSALLHIISAIAHLVHNHSETTHCTAFYFDNAAVGLTAGAVSLLSFCYTALPEHYDALKDFYMETVITGSLAISMTTSYALAKYRRNYTWQTRALFFGPAGLFFLWSCVPFFYKVYKFLFCGQTQVDFQWLYVIGMYVFIIGVKFYASCFPESHFPGAVDIFGHSHQIFHVLVTLSHLCLIWAVRQDVALKHVHLASKRRAPISPENIGYAFLLTGMTNAVFLVVLRLKYGKLSNDCGKQSK